MKEIIEEFVSYYKGSLEEISLLDKNVIDPNGIFIADDTGDIFSGIQLISMLPEPTNDDSSTGGDVIASFTRSVKSAPNVRENINSESKKFDKIDLQDLSNLLRV